jgi:hypothetical protein
MNNLNDKEQRIIAVLLEDPTVNNAQLAERAYMADSTLNKATKGLYSKLGIVGNGRRKRNILIQRLHSN